MADLRSSFIGIESPNPFWLASAPPTDKAYNINRAFEAGWGGVVWKTLGEDPPVVNVSSRYGAVHLGQQKIHGLNNIELISDRPLAVNLQEITDMKKKWPDRAIVVSLMVPCEEKSWKDILEKVAKTGADGVELNFGCPHGMSERGMGAAVGQVPEYVQKVTQWCKQYTQLPVIVKLTPNITNILLSAEAALAGGADAVSLINTINSIVGVDLDQLAPMPVVNGKGTHGGYCGPAVKPIALHMVAEIARDQKTKNLPISAIGGISTWQDAAEFILLGASTLQVCTAVMHYGFKIIDDLLDGLNNWMDQKGFKNLPAMQGKAIANVTDWQQLDMNYQVIANINQEKCIKCGLCFAVCEDTAHQAIIQTKESGSSNYRINSTECVGCNLCQHVCPVQECITMEEQKNSKPYISWKEDKRNSLVVS